MIKLFQTFIRDQKINSVELNQYTAGTLSTMFNSWVIALGQARNKTIINEANKFMIRKWIVNGKVTAFGN